MATINWRDYPMVHEHITRAQQEFNDGVYGNVNTCPFIVALDDLVMESPIEAVFAVWWRAVRLLSATWPSYAVDLFEQHEVTTSDKQRYRLDFAVLPVDHIIKTLGDVVGRPMKIAVELDGHDFHERTREQVGLRNTRDRALQADGWKVFHFSGSEIVTRQAGCAIEVITAAYDHMVSMRTAIGQSFGIETGYPKKT